ncbi:MAG: F0F1 ATP synthase subunit delta [Legionellales bacterium]|nr:F0F1 ATP synthase subunit delta [Legionellales bacterium]
MAEKLTLARPYAKAAFEFANEHKQLPNWQKSLLQLGCLMRNATMLQVVNSPAVELNAILGIIQDVLGAQFTQELHHFVQLLAQYHRLLLLPEISQLFSLYVAQQEKTIDVLVTSAFPLSESMQAKLSQALERRLQLGVFLRCSVDAELIGGAIIRAGDFVIDGSVRSQLQRMHAELIA